MSRDKINTILFERIIETCRAHVSNFTFLYLPHGDELRSQTIKKSGEYFFEQFVMTHQVSALNPRPMFLSQKDKSFTSGHYKQEEAMMIARAMHAHIMEEASFKAYIEREKIVTAPTVMALPVESTRD